MPGDGNCQFYAISDQLRQRELCDLSHEVCWLGQLATDLIVLQEVRERIAEWLKNVGSEIQVDEGLTLADASGEPDWGGYCATIATDKEWGDHMSLLAACMVFEVVL